MNLEQDVVFEEKVYLTPKDMNRIGQEETIDSILLSHLRNSLENRCSEHGFVIPGSLQVLSRSMGQLDNGKFTGNIVFHVQAQGKVYNPVNGTRLTGTILKKNKMGLYVIYEDAIRILIARDLHLNNEEFENLKVGDLIQIEIRKSRFQIKDPFILSIGVYISSDEKSDNSISKPEESTNIEKESDITQQELKLNPIMADIDEDKDEDEDNEDEGVD